MKPSKRRRKLYRSNQPQSKNDDVKEEREVNMAPTTVDLSAVMVDNETEVSTTDICAAEEAASKGVEEDSEEDAIANCQQDSFQNEEVQTVESGASNEAGREHVIGKKMYQTSLQDLIHTLLAQNQSSSIYITPEDIETDQRSSDEHVSDQKRDEQAAGDDRTEQQDQQSPVAPAGVDASPENFYDANSVALFLGHLAQQNGKKMRSVLNPVTENSQPCTSSVNFIGVKTKHSVIIEDELSIPAKYRRIRPKSTVEGNVLEIQPALAPIVEDEESDSCAEVKAAEPQCRLAIHVLRNEVQQLFDYPFTPDSAECKMD